ncbi:dehydrogenase [Paenibacillus rhizosphaerae]|uniref:Dehydrogenase n=1 Tax=Paenibacillus rhizosphaerae TaxID=297318 RepID=A0A1R1F4E7_9BACL|nr:FAD-dependent oxidoreductase [Paenibacillus rhizosphaerae]OMF58880.1 dehydrogenase [Paenibacillus rhizosphaerae]
MTAKYDVVIIGGGIAGLVAALCLAKEGKSVAVLESQGQMGGRAITNKKEGVRFNLGSHALYFGEAYAIFQELNLMPDLFKRVDEFTPYGIWKEKVYPFPVGISSLLKSPLLPLSDKVKFGAILMKVLKLDTASIPYMSLRSWMEENVDSPMIRNLLYVLARGGTYVQAPDLQVAGPLFKQMQRSIKGVYYVKKGWGSLVDQLCKEALRLGVTLLPLKKVRSVEHRNGQVQHVQCADGEVIDVSHVILTTSPKVFLKLIPHAEHTSLKLWEQQAIPITAACLDIGLRSLPNPKYQFVYGVDQPILMVNASRVKGLELSDDGDIQLFQMIKFLGQSSDPQEDRKQLERAMDLVQPNWRREVVAEQYFPKMTVVHDFMHMKRTENPGPAVPEIRGLYVAGDWATHGEYLVDGAAASAKRAACHILSREPMRV